MLPYHSVKIKNPDENLIESYKDCLICEPSGTFIKVWSTILIVILAYSATIMPYRIAFFENDDTSALYYVDTSIDFLFMLDVFVNMNTPLVSKGVITSYSRVSIFKRYLKTWFFIDIISSLPFNLITKVLSSSSFKK
jgi:hyperpolarization activated cyclic nucleotide-gated potassium channel 2